MIYLISFVLLGLISSKEFRTGIITAPSGVFVFSIVIAVGIIYNLFYPFVMAVKYKRISVFFKILQRLINGTYSAIGYMLRDGIAIGFDFMGNVWGEWVEDATTTEENTKFGHKLITLSASIGHLEHENINRNKTQKFLTWLLNKAFMQNRHAVGSWLKHLELKRIEEMNLLRKKRKL